MSCKDTCAIIVITVIYHIQRPVTSRESGCPVGIHCRNKQITDHYAPGEAAVKALQAGVDMILMPQDLQAAFDVVKQALSDGTLTQARIDESVLRILQVKAEYNILQ